MVGIRNSVLSQKLVQDEKLTLEKAVKEAKSSELVKQHHKILKGDDEEAKISAVRERRENCLKEGLTLVHHLLMSQNVLFSFESSLLCSLYSASSVKRANQK